MNEDVSAVKIIISTNNDYANSNLYEHDYTVSSAPGQNFLLNTPGLTIPADATYTFTVLVKPVLSVDNNTEYRVASTQVDANNAANAAITAVGTFTIDNNSTPAIINSGTPNVYPNVYLTPPPQPHWPTHAGNYIVGVCE